MYASKSGRALRSGADPRCRAEDARTSATRRSTGTCASVASMAVRVAARLGLDEAPLRQVELAAELHDIGKIALPDAILHKPGDRSIPDECESHAPVPGRGRADRALGAVARAASPRSCARHMSAGTATATPTACGRAEAPIGSRIIAACDAYHAMRTAQPTDLRSPETRRSPSCAGAPARSSIPTSSAP